MREKLMRIWKSLKMLKVPKMPSFMKGGGYLKLLDLYIMKKFIGTYIYAILLIISISIVFDFNEHMSKFVTNHAP